MRKKILKSTLIKVDDIIRLINLILISGRIKGEKPLSAILIANIESGKSEILELYMKFANVVWANDLSRKILIDKILPEVESGRKTHIICTDFLNVLAHNRTVVKGTLLLLNSFIEEGLKDFYFYGIEKHFKEIVRGGIIIAITREEYNFRKKHWRKIGFISRSLPISYSYKEETITAIHNYISTGFEENKFNIVIPPKRPVKISFTSKSEQQLVRIIALAKKSKYETGFRLHKHLRTLSKCIAFYNGNKKVLISDVEEMRNLLNYINFDYKKV